MRKAKPKLGTAVIKFKIGDDQIIREWSIGCMIGIDDRDTIKAHLEKWIPKAEFISVNFIPDKKR